MSDQQQHLEEVFNFLQEHRSNEGHFEKIYTKLKDECTNGYTDKLIAYKDSLQELKEKEAEAYRQMKETGGTAYPEFEKFASGFEKAVTAAIKELGGSNK